MTITERNNAIKKLVKTAFPNYPVSVRGHRGTSRGWFTVRIGYKPRDWDEHCKLLSLVESLILKSHNKEIGTFGYDDPGSDYGYGREFHVNFDH